MPSKSKRKGNAYERELVDRLKTSGCNAVRAWGSNGKALGESEEVDLIFSKNEKPWRVQAKRRAKLAAYMEIPEGADCVMMRGDRGETLVVIDLPTFLGML